jgi:hypothetical protein
LDGLALWDGKNVSRVFGFGAGQSGLGKIEIETRETKLTHASSTF